MDEQVRTEGTQETQATEQTAGQEQAGGEAQKAGRSEAEKTRENGMTMQELAKMIIDIAGPEQARGFAQDAEAQRQIAQGKNPVEAFREYRERGAAKKAAPATTQRSAGGTGRKRPSEMTSEEFRAFDKEIQEAVARGKTVRL